MSKPISALKVIRDEALKHAFVPECLKGKIKIKEPKERKVYSKPTIKHKDKTVYTRKEKHKEDLKDGGNS